MSSVRYTNLYALTITGRVFIGNGKDDKRPLEERIVKGCTVNWTLRNERPRISVKWDKLDINNAEEINFTIAPFNPIPCFQFLEQAKHLFGITNEKYNKKVSLRHKNKYFDKEFEQAETKFKYEYRNGIYVPIIVIRDLQYGHVTIAELINDKNWYDYDITSQDVNTQNKLDALGYLTLVSKLISTAIGMKVQHNIVEQKTSVDKKIEEI